jgi:translation initiation factor 2 beta subunit (eIF-2beta)/eIF-5
MSDKKIKFDSKDDALDFIKDFLNNYEVKHSIYSRQDKLTIVDLIQEILNSYEYDDRIISFKIKVKTEKSTRIIEYPDK